MTRETVFFLLVIYLDLAGLRWFYKEIAPGMLFKRYESKARTANRQDAFWNEFNKYVGLGHSVADGIQTLGVRGLRRCYRTAMSGGPK